MADLSSITGLAEKFWAWMQSQASSSSVSPSQPPPSGDPPSSPSPLPTALNLEALQKIVARIEAVLNDAEEREIGDESVRLWLEDLRDVACEAEDAMDEYEYELLRAKAEAGRQTSEATVCLPGKWTHREVCDAIAPTPPLNASFWCKTADRIKKIQGNLEEISKRRDGLHLREGEGQRRSQNIARRPPSSHLVDVPIPQGRKHDLEKVIGMLLSHECKKSALYVIPIVGIGGVGKTTLAQLVYNNSKVCNLFQLRGWVSVSDEFELIQLTRKIFESFTKEEQKLQELSALQEKLIAKVKGKRFLLVLDDVWNENPDLCDRLLLPLKYGRQGSAVIVTTRSQIVAAIMAPTHHQHHHLYCLSKKDCWEVFKQNAFHAQDAHENYQELVDIGKEIARKCKGLPLAAKSLGRLLCHSGYDVESWRDVLESNVWDVDDKTIPALMLSYVHLPNHLKQCFLYTSLFPKDSYFNKDELVRLWMAQGYIGQTRNREIETVGNSYFDELLNRSFFQKNPHDPSLFMMHDLIHDLAQCISRGEHVIMEAGIAGYLCAPKARHLSLQRSRFDTSVSDLPCLAPEAVRTVLDLTRPYKPFLGETEFITKKMLNLRVLKLKGENFCDLLEGIGNLMHLRYLHLEYYGFGISSEYLKLGNIETDIWSCYQNLRNNGILVDSVGKLYHLQTLILRHIGPKTLPTSITNLANLRHLEVGSDVTQMPRGIGRLTSLRSLDVFNVGEVGKDCAGVEELKNMVHLRGRLTISNLWCVADADKAKEADLEGKTKIWDLNLNWYSDKREESHPPEPFLHDQVLENLHPHGGLKCLTIRKYCGVRLPGWLAGHAVQVVGTEFSSSSACLETSAPQEQGIPRSVIHGVKGGDFPHLRCLKLMVCPRLKSMATIYHLPALEELVLDRCVELTSIELRSPSSSSSTSSSPPSIRSPPPLKKMKISACPLARFSPEDDEQLQLPPTLQHLLIDHKCPLLVEWCQTVAGMRSLAGIPGAKLWNLPSGLPFVSTDDQQFSLLRFLEKEKARSGIKQRRVVI